ncbi:MAG: hypothetical protein ACOYT4_02845 [Nanoarchaeota archaeon]
MDNTSEETKIKKIRTLVNRAVIFGMASLISVFTYMGINKLPEEEFSINQWYSVKTDYSNRGDSIDKILSTQNFRNALELQAQQQLSDASEAISHGRDPLIYLEKASELYKIIIASISDSTDFPNFKEGYTNAQEEIRKQMVNYNK